MVAASLIFKAIMLDEGRLLVTVQVFRTRSTFVVNITVKSGNASIRSYAFLMAQYLQIMSSHT